MVTPPKKGAKPPAPPPPAPSSRRKVDWDAVERDFRATQMTLRELGAKHQADPAAIHRKSKQNGWTRDLTPAVRQATTAALIQSAVNEQVNASQQEVNNTVLVVAELNKQVILGHRADVKSLRNLTAGLMAELAQSALAATEQDELAALLVTLQSGEVMTGDRLTKAQALVRKSLELPGRIASAKALAETFTRLQLLERTAFGLDEKTPPEDPGAHGGKSLTDVERAVRLLHFLNRGGQQQ